MFWVALASISISYVFWVALASILTIFVFCHCSFLGSSKSIWGHVCTCSIPRRICAQNSMSWWSFVIFVKKLTWGVFQMFWGLSVISNFQGIHVWFLAQWGFFVISNSLKVFYANSNFFWPTRGKFGNFQSFERSVWKF